MSRQQGILKLVGTLNGKCFYQLNGQYIVRKAVGPSRERINNDPAFINVKGNNQEFAAASQLSKAIRQGLGDKAQQFKYNHMASRLTGRCRKIIQKGSGQLGQREANLLNAPSELIGFQLNSNVAFNQLYNSKINVTANTQRSLITVKCPQSTAKQQHKMPKNATHYQLIAAISCISKRQWQPHLNAYKTAHPEQNTLGAAVQSEPLPLNTTHNYLQLQWHSPTPNGISTEVAITVWLGIAYQKQQNQTYQTFKTPQAMECIAIL
ncbi:hypothetical protein [Winogradskyella schleiferi]|uniref:hypothetical protein n=1 Tax=Winogradskyella schleiferi TaxID=2686078 RepID=UPI0015B94F1C|nr:hypothetical protein [Winogradskyella schleiferi]